MTIQLTPTAFEDQISPQFSWYSKTNNLSFVADMTRFLSRPRDSSDTFHKFKREQDFKRDCRQVHFTFTKVSNESLG